MSTARQKVQAFYKANAAKGRSVRFSINIDASHVPHEEAKKHGLGVSVKITQGTLRPEAARKILDLVFEEFRSETEEKAT